MILKTHTFGKDNNPKRSQQVRTFLFYVDQLKYMAKKCLIQRYNPEIKYLSPCNAYFRVNSKH